MSSDVVLPSTLRISVTYDEAKTKDEARKVGMDFVRDLMRHYRFPKTSVIITDVEYLRERRRWEVDVKIHRDKTKE